MKPDIGALIDAVMRFSHRNAHALNPKRLKVSKELLHDDLKEIGIANNFDWSEYDDIANDISLPSAS